MGSPVVVAALAPWHEFYALLGGASATLTGLLFVAASIGSGVFGQSSVGRRMFLSASVVHFASVLTASLIVLAPIRSIDLLSLFVIGCGVFGMGYCATAWRDLVRGGRAAKVDWEDRIWYAVLPAISYLLVMVAGMALPLDIGVACGLLPFGLGSLLLIAIHNAWDITVWSITRNTQ